MLWDLKNMQCNLKEMVDIVEIVQAVVMVDIVDIVDIDIVDTVEIVDIFDTFNIVDINEAIWNKARLLKQSQKRYLINHPLSIMALRDASASKKP